MRIVRYCMLLAVVTRLSSMSECNVLFARRRCVNSRRKHFQGLRRYLSTTFNASKHYSTVRTVSELILRAFLLSWLVLLLPRSAILVIVRCLTEISEVAFKIDSFREAFQRSGDVVSFRGSFASLQGIE
ncbi:hypothetical protein EJ03DRAFT_207313 [Teratosphaeria nubilosa]|uniref:Secreted protein n=1 Tax=Teratosphaeria nubilosa TaxID=161662 RepID=A0A6G1KXP5_9PEZI|nr:hypothetical protein EJ03DRAFT_207313 [Teratosphaeria nubilosa]